MEGDAPDVERDIWTFKTSETPTDVKLIVEGRPIHFYKALLVLSSPVFCRMFDSEFKEKDSDSVDLPDKNLGEFMLFLEQLHPAFAWKALAEESLECLLKLADEYDVGHIKTKCQTYIVEQTEYSLNTEQTLRYLWLSDTYSLGEALRNLITVATDYTSTELKQCRHYYKLQMSTQLQLMTELCQSLEKKNIPDALAIKTKQFVRQFKLAAKTLYVRKPDFFVQCGCCVECEAMSVGPGYWESKLRPGYSSGGVIWCRCRPKCFGLSSLKHSCSTCIREKIAVMLQTFKAMFQPLEKGLYIDESIRLKI